MDHRRSIFLVGIFCILSASSANARQLEIIHTNDLHSHIDQADDADHGSYAAVKAVIDSLKAEAQAEGVETLALDAGDFSEGTPYYAAGNGTDSWRIMQEMGYDAITIGNHDWLVGPAQMDAIAQDVQPTTPLLSANLHVNPRFKALNRFIVPYALFNKSGLKIAVVGLSTDDILYSWRLADGRLDPPNMAMWNEAQDLRSSTDLLIALTHLGVAADESLAKSVDGIDVIVGGHSHTVLKEPIFQRSPSGTEVPIVQTGSHGNYVGDLRIDYEPGQPVKVLHYRLVPVLKNGPQDPAIASHVLAEEQDLKSKYGESWLDAPLTYSNFPMESPMDHPTAWSEFYLDAIREAANADLALDSSEFFGTTQPAGPITRRAIMNFYPRYFDLNRADGWNVWTIHAPGWFLAAVLSATATSGHFFNLSNVTYDVDTSTGVPQLKNLKIGGHFINPIKEYRVAVTEGIGLGAKKIASGILGTLFWPSDTGVPVWTAVEEKIRRGDAASSKTARLPASVRWSPARMDQLIRP